MSRTRPRTRRYPNFTDGQVKSLVNDGKYRHRDISKLNKLQVPYDSIKDMETFYRENDPSISQKELSKRTAVQLIKAWRSRRSSNSSGTRSRRGSNSSGTRSRRGSNSSGTRSRRRSSGTRSRRGSRSNSSGTQGRRITSSRSLHTSDL